MTIFFTCLQIFLGVCTIISYHYECPSGRGSCKTIWWASLLMLTAFSGVGAIGIAAR
ncbi:MAG TPA: hypothetical protein VGR84_18715 [Candidatus Acidoferrales bacterium]|nr:hypothetical protein [Candidatus Acidoferrales bacterium]